MLSSMSGGGPEVGFESEEDSAEAFEEITPPTPSRSPGGRLLSMCPSYHGCPQFYVCIYITHWPSSPL